VGVGDHGRLGHDQVGLLEAGDLRRRQQGGVLDPDLGRRQDVARFEAQIRRRFDPTGGHRKDERTGDEGVMEQEAHGFLQ